MVAISAGSSVRGDLGHAWRCVSVVLYWRFSAFISSKRVWLLFRCVYVVDSGSVSFRVVSSSLGPCDIVPRCCSTRSSIFMAGMDSEVQVEGSVGKEVAISWCLSARDLIWGRLGCSERASLCSFVRVVRMEAVDCWMVVSFDRSCLARCTIVSRLKLKLVSFSYGSLIVAAILSSSSCIWVFIVGDSVAHFGMNLCCRVCGRVGAFLEKDRRTGM